MADPRIEREREATAWPWILGLVVLALLVWAFAANRTGTEDGAVNTGQTQIEPRPSDPRTGDRSVAIAPVPPPADGGAAPGYPAADANAQLAVSGAILPVAAIVQQPQDYLQQSLTGTVRVAEVESRGMWVEQDGQRLFVLVNPSDDGQALATLRPGQDVTLTGVVHDRDSAAVLANDVDAAARAVVDTQPAFLFVQGDDIDTTTMATASLDDENW